MFKCKYLIFLLLTHSLCALTTLQVTVSTDNNPGGIGDVGDLRYCLNTMNQQLNSSPDDYEIVFDFPMTIQLNGILPIINNSPNPVNITIGNPGSTQTVTIDGQNTYPGFFIPTGNVTIQNMIFQNCTAQGGNGGDGISGGGGGLGAGGAIFAPQFFLNGSNPSITLMNVSMNGCSAVGGNGGSYFTVVSPTGNEGGGGGGGFAGAGGSITTTGSTGGGGGGGLGGNGGDVTLSTDDPSGGGGGGGGGIGSGATLGTPTNLGHGGSDQSNGDDGNGYGLSTSAGSGAGGYTGGNDAGGGGGGGVNGSIVFGGGGGGSSGGGDGMQPLGNLTPGGSAVPSGGNGGDGGGGGGAGVVAAGSSNSFDGAAGAGGYGAGGGGGAGTGAYDAAYTVEGGSGGIGGGGGGGGVNQSRTTPADGGNSTGGGGGGAGPGNSDAGGTDIGNLGGGSGGYGASDYGTNFGGGGAGGGSGLGGAIFIDSNLNFTIQALAGIPTVFTTVNCITQAGIGGIGGPEATDGLEGSALGNSIFLRSGSSLNLIASQSDDILTLGEQVSFVDDTVFGGQGTSVTVRGDGTVVYNGTTDYQGTISINNTNLKVNGTITQAPVFVCRDINFSLQRGTLSGSGLLSGNVFANSGAIWPDAGQSLTLGSLQLSPAAGEMLGSLVHIEIDSSGTSLVSIAGSAQLAGVLEIDIDQNAQPGSYTILTSSDITGTFDSILFTGDTPNYSLSYLPIGSPTYIQFNFFGFLQAASNFQGVQKNNNFGLQYELYNQLTWTPSSSSQVAGYYLYRDEIKIATVSAATVSYQDHNRPVGTSCVYWLVAFDSDGNVSSPVTVTVSSL